jgi:hypothetical protein
VAKIFAKNDMAATIHASEALDNAIVKALYVKPGLRGLQEIGPKRLFSLLVQKDSKDKKKYKTLTPRLVGGAVILEAIIECIDYDETKVKIKILFPLSGKGDEVELFLKEVIRKFHLVGVEVNKNGLLTEIYLTGDNFPVVLNRNGRARFNPLWIIWGTQSELEGFNGYSDQ